MPELAHNQSQMKQKKVNHKTDSLFGPTGRFTGYSLVFFGAVSTYYNLSGLILVITGLFMGFTFSGTIIDYDARRIKGYTSIFGLFRYGKWYGIDSFTRFSIYKSRRSYTTYSRANIPLTIKEGDIRLVLLNESGSLKVIVNKFSSFESARNEMSGLINALKMKNMEEWRK
jgi:hypothetical protein